MNDHGLSYFDDYVPGTAYECGSVSFDQASIATFAKEFDPQPFHVDPVAAAAGPYRGLIASGWHTASAVMRVLVENYLAAESSLGSAGLDQSAGLIRSGPATRSVSGPRWWSPAAR